MDSIKCSAVTLFLVLIELGSIRLGLCEEVQPLKSDDPRVEITADGYSFRTRLFRARGFHSCWSDKGIGHKCSVGGTDFTNCNEAYYRLKQRDCCSATRDKGKSVDFSLSSCSSLLANASPRLGPVAGTRSPLLEQVIWNKIYDHPPINALTIYQLKVSNVAVQSIPIGRQIATSSIPSSKGKLIFQFRNCGASEKAITDTLTYHEKTTLSINMTKTYTSVSSTALTVKAENISQILGISFDAKKDTTITLQNSETVNYEGDFSFERKIDTKLGSWSDSVDVYDFQRERTQYSISGTIIVDADYYLEGARGAVKVGGPGKLSEIFPHPDDRRLEIEGVIFVDAPSVNRMSAGHFETVLTAEEKARYCDARAPLLQKAVFVHAE